MDRWLKLKVPRFNKWYNRLYYRIFHPEIHRWLDHCARVTERKVEFDLLMGKFQQARVNLRVYGWGLGQTALEDVAWLDDCKEGD